MNYNESSLQLHEKHKGKIEVCSKVPLRGRDDLSMAYTPGVAEPCRRIHQNEEDVYRYTAKGNLVAVVSDGTAVLGLGNIGPKAAIPVFHDDQHGTAVVVTAGLMNAVKLTGQKLSDLEVIIRIRLTTSLPSPESSAARWTQEQEISTTI